ncbi:OmpA-like transmembrane domain protein [Oleispira antarctica RB-8]|uniref:OmpA-like transmembrane domain protein n=1 Tax=Oleispira antarctica RB-8 TaxID=698738 RepID=R4YM04_OLEAN|nr:OmpA-like transmembrane domain protein [Oleispira antarctica RB-8]
MKKVVLGALLGLSALPAVANEGYFSGEVLLGKTDQELKSDFGDTDGDDSSFGIRGAYNLNKNVAFELGYMNHGEIDDTYIDEFGDTINDRFSSTAFNLGVKGVIPFENGFSLHGRLGLSFWDVELEETDSAFPGETFKGDDSGTDFYYGIGAQYTINEQFTIGAEYTLSEYGIKSGGDFTGLDADIDVKTLALSAGLNF